MTRGWCLTDWYREKEQVEVAEEERGVCMQLFLAPGSPARCCAGLLELERHVVPEALVLLS